MLGIVSGSKQNQEGAISRDLFHIALSLAILVTSINALILNSCLCLPMVATKFVNSSRENILKSRNDAAEPILRVLVEKPADIVAMDVNDEN